MAWKVLDNPERSLAAFRVLSLQQAAKWPHRLQLIWAFCLLFCLSFAQTTGQKFGIILLFIFLAGSGVLGLLKPAVIFKAVSAVSLFALFSVTTYLIVLVTIAKGISVGPSLFCLFLLFFAGWMGYITFPMRRAFEKLHPGDLEEASDFSAWLVSPEALTDACVVPYVFQKGTIRADLRLYITNRIVVNLGMNKSGSALPKSDVSIQREAGGSEAQEIPATMKFGIRSFGIKLKPDSYNKLASLIA
jgi:hypothetical protein